MTLYKAACNQLDFIPDDSIDCVVTSTAYWGKRSYNQDYGVEQHEDEMGRGSLDAYIEEQAALGKEMWHLLRDTGTYWLNLGDTNSGSGGAGGDHNIGGSKENIARYKQGDVGDLAPRQQLLIPWRVALVLQEQGWLVRKVITWDKGVVKPEDPKHVRRPRFSSETILMLVKSWDYTYHHEREEEPGDVWHFPPYRGPRKGPAPFPDELPARCIALSTNQGQVVLDPCAGTNTTGRVAEWMGRRWISTDLYLGEPPPLGVYGPVISG